MSDKTTELKVIESELSAEQLLERYSVNAVVVLLGVMERSGDAKLMLQAAQYVLDRVIGKARPADEPKEIIPREELLPRLEAAIKKLKKG